MQIELLWIIPIVAFSFFIFLLIYFAQQKKEGPDHLSQEVSRFNSGLQQHNQVKKAPEDRLNELERAVFSVTESISNQIHDHSAKKNNNSDEIEDLKKKLRELYKELDIIASENYSLRAKVKKLQQDKGAFTEIKPQESAPSNKESASPGKVNLKLYEDTRLLNLNTLEDTSEIDMINNAE